LQVAREFIAAVGHEPEDRNRRAGIFREPVSSWRGRPSHPSKRRLFRKMDAWVKPTHDG
jgi:hypothetical protein